MGFYVYRSSSLLGENREVSENFHAGMDSILICATDFLWREILSVGISVTFYDAQVTVVRLPCEKYLRNVSLGDRSEVSNLLEVAFTKP